jgi:uncharacterized NAD-dependent epimerase/dehydratase family protein
MYILNEGKDEQRKVVYSILYPTPKTNNGSAEVSAKQQIETSSNTFTGERGTEIVWLIWAATKQDDLESIWREAFDNKGVVKGDDNIQRLKTFLEKKKENKTEASKDTANQQTIVKANGDVVAHRIELEHR